MTAKMLTDCPIGRWKKGEIGKIIENDYSSKYDYKIEFDKIKNPGINFGIIRIFYFYKNEVEVIN